MSLVAGGMLLHPLGDLRLAGRKLKADGGHHVDPADLDLGLHYSNNDLTLAATVKQPQIQPLTIKGHVPLDLEATAKTAKLDPTLPLDLQVQLPPSSLAIVPKLSPQVRRIDGTHRSVSCAWPAMWKSPILTRLRRHHDLKARAPRQRKRAGHRRVPRATRVQ